MTIKKLLAPALAWALLLAAPAYAESVTGPTPTTVGTSLPGQVAATATNDDAAAGKIGEYVESVITVASPTASFGNDTPKNITSISLTAGDWDVEASASTAPAGTTTTTRFQAAINTTTGTLPADELRSVIYTASGAGNAVTVSLPRRRFSLAVTTTIYLVASIQYAISTMGGAGFINARRVR